MNNLKMILKNKKIIIFLIGIITLISICIYINYNSYQNTNSIEILESMEKEVFENNYTNEENNYILKEDSTESNEIIDKKGKIVIHITGEVKKKGVLYLAEGSRIADAIELAGGTTKNANLDQVNLAYELKDGQKISIPNKNEEIRDNEYIIENSGNNVIVDEGRTTSNSKEVKKVNINTATQTELETLSGIGTALAQRIIEYREANGKFEKIEEIQNVKGIGDSKFSNIKDNICI